jgi:hypothetical protein
MPERIIFSACYPAMARWCAAKKLGINTLVDGGCQLFWEFFAKQ